MRRHILTMCLVVVFLLSYLTGVFQFAIFGDFTYRLARSFNLQEDDATTAMLIEKRWEVVHFIDQF